MGDGKRGDKISRSHGFFCVPSPGYTGEKCSAVGVAGADGVCKDGRFHCRDMDRTAAAAVP